MKSSEPKHIAYLRIIDQSIIQNVYSAPSASLLRGAPDPGEAERTVGVRRVRRPRASSRGHLFWWKMVIRNFLRISEFLFQKWGLTPGITEPLHATGKGSLEKAGETACEQTPFGR